MVLACRSWLNQRKRLEISGAWGRGELRAERQGKERASTFDCFSRFSSFFFTHSNRFGQVYNCKALQQRIGRGTAVNEVKFGQRLNASSPR